MKTFKSYLTEIINDGSQYRNPEFHALNDRLLGIITNHMDTTGPAFRIPGRYTGEKQYEMRTYKWNNWHKAINALSSSISGHHLMSKMLVADSTPEQAKTEGNKILGKHHWAISQFKTQHLDMLHHLNKTNPEAHSIIKRLTGHYNMPFEDLSSIHFTTRLNETLMGHQMHLSNAMDDVDPYYLDDPVNHQVSYHNKQVMKHQHPLGLFLNGGVGTEGHAHGAGPFAPDSVHLGIGSNSKDVTKDYFERPQQ